MLRPAKMLGNIYPNRRLTYAARFESWPSAHRLPLLQRAKRAAPLRVLGVGASLAVNRTAWRYPCSQGSWPLCDSASKSIDTATAQ